MDQDIITPSTPFQTQIFNEYSPMIPYNWLTEAQQRISPYIHLTPLTHDPGNLIYLKWENHQVTGSFKARGAINKMLSLQDWEIRKGIVTASAGNHGQGIALAGQIANSKVIVYASKHAFREKLSAISEMGAEIRLVDEGFEKAEEEGRSYAQKEDMTWISPYNDGQVIAGQGTIGLEVMEDPTFIDRHKQTTWIVPTSGGGLISGLCIALKSPKHPPERIRLVGVQSEASALMCSIFRQGTQENVADLPTIADGLSGAVERKSVTIPIVKKYVDDLILVTEQEITDAISFAWKSYNEKIEGAAATALAAVISGKISDRPVVLILSGGNIAPSLHQRIIKREWKAEDLNKN